MKIAIYGNNLNMGYFLALWLRELGHDSKVFLHPYEFPQEYHFWWSDAPLKGEALHLIPSLNVYQPRLVDDPSIRAVYREAERCDALLLAEDGPAIFSELESVPRALVSWGSDIQNYPFAVEQHFGWSLLRDAPARWWNLLTTGRVLGPVHDAVSQWRMRTILRRLERRQRRGLDQCGRLIIAPYQRPLAARLEIPSDRLRFFPPPMDAGTLTHCDFGAAAGIADALADCDLVLLHPTRQFFLPLNGDPFLKCNDRLIRAYAEFVSRSDCRSKLVLVRKGRAQDLDEAGRLIERLGIAAHVLWIDELTNKALRALYALPNVVVCDQFSENLPSLGNIGREAVFFGCPLITSYEPDNSLMMGSPPPNVFPAQKDHEILSALERVAGLSRQAREEMRDSCREYFLDHYHYSAALQKYLGVLDETIAAAGTNGKKLGEAA